MLSHLALIFYLQNIADCLRYVNVLKSECQQLICEILRATPEATSADAAVQTARLAGKVPSKEKRQVELLCFLINYSRFLYINYVIPMICIC